MTSPQLRLSRPAIALPMPMPMKMALALALALALVTFPAPAQQWLQDGADQCLVWSPGLEGVDAVVWIGPCVEGRAEGEGIALWRAGEQTVAVDVGTFAGGALEGAAISLLPGGVRYAGQYAESVASGLGVLSWKSGDRYAGELIESRFEGPGVFTWADGERYEGDWAGGGREGFGEHIPDAAPR